MQDKPASRRPLPAADEVAQIRAEMMVLQAAVADLAAELARRGGPAGETWLGGFCVLLLGYADAAGRGLGPGSVAPRTSAAVERMVTWAEGWFRSPPAAIPAPKP
jgi:hypothetical protein